MEEFYLDISVVVPVYNSEHTLRELFLRTKTTFEKTALRFNVIFVDDFSKDKSWEVIQQLKIDFPNYVNGIRLAKNYGQHNASLCGIKHATGEWIVTIDDDLEYEPENILLLIDEQKRTKADLVYGVVGRKKKTLLKKIVGNIYKKAAKYLEGEEKCVGSSFRLMNNKLAKAILTHGRNFSFIDEFVLWHTSNIVNISINVSSTIPKKSRYSYWKLVYLTQDLIFFSSTVPLRLVTLLGTFMVIINFIAGVITIYRRLVLTIDEKGYTSIIVAILFSSGLIILCLGIIAEYISKLLKVSYNKPAFIEYEII